MLRLSDEAETYVNLADPTEAAASASSTGGCLLIAGYEGAPAEVARRRAAATAVLQEHGGENQGEGPGEAWRVGRFRGPYLRDTLLDVGALVETLETATFWSNLPALKAAVTQAIEGALARTALRSSCCATSATSTRRAHRCTSPS